MKELIEKVKAWLGAEQPDHEEGCSLLKKALQNPGLYSYVSSGQGGSYSEILRYELNKWMGNQPVETNEPQLEGINPEDEKLGNGNSTIDDETQKPHLVPREVELNNQGTGSLQETGELEQASTKTQPETKEETIERLTVQASELFVERCKLSNQLATTPEGESLKQMVVEIIELVEKHRGVWAAIDALKAGKDPANLKPAKPTFTKTPSELSEAELRLEKSQLNSYITRVRNGAIHKSKPQVYKDELIAQKQAELDIVELLLAKARGAK